MRHWLDKEHLIQSHPKRYRQEKKKKEPRGKFPEHFHLEARWNLLTKVSALSRACIRQSGTGDETDKHTQETSTTLSVNWL